MDYLKSIPIRTNETIDQITLMEGAIFWSKIIEVYTYLKILWNNTKAAKIKQNDIKNSNKSFLFMLNC